jgi:hypothetical protein
LAQTFGSLRQAIRMNPKNHSDDFAGQTKTERKKAIERLMGDRLKLF